jgi:hypothetical protein
MSHFAPNLIPEHQMYPALITPDEFYAGIGKLDKRLAQHLLYVRDSDAVMVAPTFWLAAVDITRMKAEQSNPELAKYLREVTERWVVTIARSAMEHPLRNMIFKGIATALVGGLPKDSPAWVAGFERVLVTDKDNLTYIPPKAQIASPVNENGWGLRTEPTADLVEVFEFLGYGKPEKIKPGPKPKKE